MPGKAAHREPEDMRTMKSLTAVSILSLAGLAACGGRDHTPSLEAPAAAVVEEALPVEPEPAIDPSVTGLEMFDTETGFSLVDVGIQDELTGLSPPKFAMHCNTVTKTLEAVAPARQLGSYAEAGPAQFVVSGEAFPGEAVLVNDNGTGVSMTLPLTPELLAAIATTVSARIMIGDGFAESHDDINGAFPGFAGQCSLKSGVPFPPR
jgi:hypothetical protein